jgi:hypothetical protein
VCIRDILDILNTMLTWRCTKCVTSRYGKCHNISRGVVYYSVSRRLTTLRPTVRPICAYSQVDDRTIGMDSCP